VKNGVSAWLSKWKRSDWKTKSKKLVKNDDLWRALDSHASKHQVKWHWLKGHAGHAANERCDQLAKAEIAKIKKAFSREQLNVMLLEFLAKDSAEQSQDELEIG
jgi:ribonuclease HI